MATGYTHKLIEEGQSFPEFAMTCARAFGALIEMRDSSLDAPIPERFVASKYHLDHVKEARLEYKRLSSMKLDERVGHGVARKNRALREYDRMLRNEQEQNSRIDAMIVQVGKWNPPSSEHDGLREFMLEQLRISRNNNSWTERQIATIKAKEPIDYWQNDVDSAKRDISYHQEEMKKERDRAAGRTKWVSQLRKSLKLA